MPTMTTVIQKPIQKAFKLIGSKQKEVWTGHVRPEDPQKVMNMLEEILGKGWLYRTNEGDVLVNRQLEKLTDNFEKKETEAFTNLLQQVRTTLSRTPQQESTKRERLINYLRHLTKRQSRDPLNLNPTISTEDIKHLNFSQSQPNLKWENGNIFHASQNKTEIPLEDIVEKQRGTFAWGTWADIEPHAAVIGKKEIPGNSIFRIFGQSVVDGKILKNDLGDNLFQFHPLKTWVNQFKENEIKRLGKARGMNNLRINRILRYFKAKGTGENPFRELDALKETALRDTKLMSEANIQRLVDKKAISNNPSIPWDVENKGSDAIKAFKLEVARDQYAEIIARHQLFAKNRTVKLEV